MEKLRVVSLMVAGLGLALCVGSCNQREWDKFVGNEKKPESVISINKIVKYPKAKMLEKKIKTFSGQEIYVNMNSMLFASEIKDIELLPRDPDGRYYDLKLMLGRKGRLCWLQISAGFAHDKLAFLVDGMCYRTFTPRRMEGGYEDENAYVIIDGPFDRGIAEAIAAHAEDNYYYFNNRPDKDK